MSARPQPRWLTRRMLFDAHHARTAGHEAIVRSALSAPPKLFDRDPEMDLAALAASYAVGLAQTHGFMDGGKRAAFVAAYVFLGLNGYDLDAAEPEVVSAIERVAAREISEAALAAWLRNRCEMDR